jgi:alpha-glucosidase (family GH31 glycosyl hydrolase)
MKLKLTFTALAAVVAAFSLSAGLPNEPKVVDPSAIIPHTLRAENVGPEKRTVVVTAYTNNIIRVDNYLPGDEPAKSKLVVADDGFFNGDVIENPYSGVMTSPDGLVVTLDKTTGAVTLTEKGKGLYDDGSRSTDAKGRKTFKLTPIGGGEAYYGGGERGLRYNLVGDTLVMYNRQNYGYTGNDPRIRQMNITMPLLVTPDGFGFMVDDYAAAELITSNPLEYASEAPYSLSYYFFGSSKGMPGLATQVGRLTGRQALPPFWALGYISSKYGYKTQAETIGVADTLRREGYPLDGMVLDLYWYGQEQDMGRLDWDPEQWPYAQKMLADLKARGINLVTISQPYVLRNGRGLDNYNYLAPRGMFGRDSLGNVKDVTIWVGEGGMLDVSNPETRQWLRNRYKQLTDGGITGWWGDLGEPEVHPDGMIHCNGLTNRQYHNLYGNDWSRIIYELFKEEYPETRLMTLMRGGTIGLQRYSVFPWSTDVSRSWGGLEPQIRIMLNSGLSGLGYMSHDVGGFAIDPAHPVDPELYVRWLQVGLFSPILRTHAQSTAEPYKYPELKNILLPLIKERYRWLPYNYSLAAENARQGLPLVRPIGYYDSDPAALDAVVDQYLWGRDVMVAPVLTQGATSREVVFPEGEWVDINNPQKVYHGGEKATVDAPLAVLPLFARGGAQLPKADYKMQNVGDYDASRYTIDYYPTENCGATTFTLFEDNRESATSLDKGQYALLNLQAENSASQIKLSVEKPQITYTEMPAKRTLTYVVHNVDRPKKVTANLKIKQNYNKSTRTLTVTASSIALPLEIVIEK